MIAVQVRGPMGPGPGLSLLEQTDMSSRIPTLDITRFDSDREAFVAELGAAYR